MNATTLPPRLLALATNPWVLLSSLAAGLALGALAPQASLMLGVVGELYAALLKMVVLPFVVSAIVFSLQRLLREGGSAALLARVVTVFAALALLTAVVGALTLVVARPGAELAPQTLQTFGRLIDADGQAGDVSLSLAGDDEPAQAAPGPAQVLLGMVPSNVFAALAVGDTIKAVVFALLFGLAVGQVPARVSDALSQSLETVYTTCELITRWLKYPLPLVLLCMSAAQLARTGLEPLRAMMAFVLSFMLAAALVLALAVAVVWRRSGRSLGQTLRALQEPFGLALATLSSVNCMPALVEALAGRLGFARARVELLVPLTLTLLCLGPMLYYVCATLFIAQLYGRSLGGAELALVVAAGVVTGFASAGMSGLVTVSLTSMACGYLGLPFEAAFILFAAVDLLCDMLRTVLVVIGNAAAVSLICPPPLKI